MVSLIYIDTYNTINALHAFKDAFEKDQSVPFEISPECGRASYTRPRVQQTTRRASKPIPCHLFALTPQPKRLHAGDSKRKI